VIKVIKVINWGAAPEEADLIHKIAERAVSDSVAGRGLNLLDVEMDITACHLNGNPIRLNDLLHANNFNFWHDINGIRHTLDRETGQLQDYFSPRFSKREVD
jgi:hypothetical protein